MLPINCYLVFLQRLINFLYFLIELPIPAENEPLLGYNLSSAVKIIMRLKKKSIFFIHFDYKVADKVALSNIFSNIMR
jgi:hypothetical protein